jgi:REP element-mobilizing transposase RayT
MARHARIEIPGGWYYISNQGPHRKALFRNEADRQFFISLLADAHRRYRVQCHAFCLLKSSYHLVLQTPEANLQRVMRHINALYTQYYNREYRQEGSLFTARYRSLLIDGEHLALPLGRHLHLLPVSNRESDDVFNFEGSSCHYYVKRAQVPSWFSTASADTLKIRYKRTPYQSYLAESVEDTLDDFIEQHRSGAVAGNAQFVKSMRRAGDRKHPSRNKKERPLFKDIVEKTARHFKVDLEKVMVSTRGRGVDTPARSVAMYLCQELGGMTLQEIADHFALAGYASAGSTIRNVRHRIKEDKQLSNVVTTLQSTFNSK